jgi:hypothetical protein
MDEFEVVDRKHWFKVLFLNMISSMDFVSSEDDDFEF